MEFKDSKTYKNLIYALAGESIARNKYDWYASQAKKDGFEEISKIFSTIALNEKEHAKLWFKLTHGISNTYENLLNAAKGENEEWTDMYAQFTKTALEEGFEDIAKVIAGVGSIERSHEKKYLKLAEDIKLSTVFHRDSSVVWECANCGHQHISTDAPDLCSVCNHPTAFFFIKK